VSSSGTRVGVLPRLLSGVAAHAPVGLGDHLELHGALPVLARDLAELAAEVFGEERVTSAGRLDDAIEAAALLRPRLAPGDTVLVKGSRGMALEQVAEELGRR